MKNIKGFIDPISLGIALVVAVSAVMTTVDHKAVDGQQQLAQQSQAQLEVVVTE